MSKNKRPEGNCRICGLYGPLSFEHVPPRGAFNNHRVIGVNFEEAITLGPDEINKGTIQQKGAGEYTLCERCNNNTGAWYAEAFITFSYQAMGFLQKSEGKPSMYYPYYILPLQVIKQIVTMFFSVNSDDFRLKNQELVEFVLNREKRYLSHKYRVFVYYNLSNKARRLGISGKLNFEKNQLVIMSEITFPPFGYVLTINSQPPNNEMIDITHFSRWDYNEYASTQLRLPILPVNTVLPGDYRSKELILADMQANLEFERNNPSLN